MKNKALFALGVSASMLAACKSSDAGRPNIILIMADDMGYSDLGCYGGEIPTPNLDRLAGSGVRYTQFYSTARSCPTRASLMTGLYAHQAGIGEMSEDPGSRPEKSADVPPAYLGYLNNNCVTIAEVLKDAGYSTYMTGKWHLGMHDFERMPLQRGFDRFYGILSGACSYLKPQGSRGLTLDNTKLDSPAAPYYTTDAFTDYALEFLDGNEEGRPYFLYLAYNAPHWPLHAKQEDIDKFLNKYDKGWEAVRQERFRRMVELGIVDESCGLAEWESRSWDELTEEERSNSSLRMSVYAAQVHCMDYNVGRILDWVEKSGEKDNTLIIFLSDNGACAEPYSETGDGSVDDINDQDSWNPPSYGLPWAQVSNTPHRKYKVRAYEGGLSVPLIMSWPERFSEYDGELRANVGYLQDIMATIVDATGASYPVEYEGNVIYPMEGGSLIPTVYDPEVSIHDYIYGEHFGNCYVRHGDWKAVRDQWSDTWELYNMAEDRTERRDLARQHPETLSGLVEKWQEWADSHGVYPKRYKK